MISSIARVSLARVSVARVASRFYSEAGSVGSVRPGGEKSSDSFQKREKAQEDFYVRQVEKQKIEALREAIKKQREHLDELATHLDSLDGTK
ncbi:ATPase [Limtongia smithiae]|uniref:ATPase n=1 Tax=Limtongia smithiae TaxID=1125753 RepID=UPI0034CFB139